MLTSGLPWVIEWPCWFTLENLESRIERGERCKGARAVSSKGERRRAASNAATWPCTSLTAIHAHTNPTSLYVPFPQHPHPSTADDERNGPTNSASVVLILTRTLRPLVVLPASTMRLKRLSVKSRSSTLLLTLVSPLTTRKKDCF